MKKVVWVLQQSNKGSFIYTFFLRDKKMKQLIHSITFVIILSISTQYSAASLIVSQDSKQNIDSDYSVQEATNRLIKKANDFRYSLSRGEKLESFMSDSWSFIYHEDNRCDGSTDGSLSGLSPRQVDQALRIQLFNDGKGWACEPRKPTSFEANFSLHNQVASWDRFEVTQYGIMDNLVYIEGEGSGGYLKVYFDEFNGELLIVRLEYRSEDPG
jgi:hypothetical protein